jgi:drug/metabolite transporter (DMT)-like permease
VPLATLLLAVLWRQEHLGTAAFIGTLLALAGIAVISRDPVQQDLPLLALEPFEGGLGLPRPPLATGRCRRLAPLPTSTSNSLNARFAVG